MQLKYIFILLTINFIFFSCAGKDGDLRMKDIHEKVAEKVAKHKQIKRNTCRKKVLKAAGVLADSILLAEARLKRDTAGRPLIPSKPVVPEIKEVIDTLPVAPFFRDSSLEWKIMDSVEIK